MIVAASVDTEFFAVQPDSCFPVHGFEMQEHALILPIEWNCKGTPAPQALPFGKQSLYTGQPRFNWKRSKDSVGKTASVCLGLTYNAVIPLATEAQPLGSLHLRTRVFAMRIRRENVTRRVSSKGVTIKGEC